VKALIHIGVGKTGTTSLQRNLFAHHTGIRNIGRPYTDDEFRRAVESLREDDEADYRPFAFRRLCELAATRADGRAIVLSDETLVHPVHQSLIAKRLSSVLPEAHILITIRNQYDLIASYWAAHGRNLKGVPGPYLGKTVTFDDWFAFEAQAKRSFFSRLDFYRLYQIYAEIFGADRVHVMTFEELAGKPVPFAHALAALIGVDENEMSELIMSPPAKTRPSEATAKYRALRARMLPKVALSQIPGGAAVRRAINRFIEAGPPLAVTLTPAQRDIIGERFGPGNKALAATIGVDLAGLRYPSPSDQAPTRHREETFVVPASGGRA
jgi:hypothetical protein